MKRSVRYAGVRVIENIVLDGSDEQDAAEIPSRIAAAQLPAQLDETRSAAREVLDRAGIPVPATHLMVTARMIREALGDDSLEYRAIKILVHVAELERAVAAGNAEAAALAALDVGRWRIMLDITITGVEDDAVARRVHRERSGRRATGEHPRRHEHLVWFAEDQDLAARIPSASRRAEIIAERHGSKTETVRAAIRRLKKVGA